MRRRTSVLVIFIGLVAVAAASVASMYPSVSDAQDAVDTAWATVRPELGARYEAVAALSRAVRAADADLELLDEVDDALGDWAAGIDGPPRAAVEPKAANRAEGGAARLARTVTTRPSLRGNRDVVVALQEYLLTDPTASLQPFNDAVERYDKTRSRFPGAFLASLIGFDAMETVEVPLALADLEVPEAPAEPTPTTGAGATTTTES